MSNCALLNGPDSTALIQQQLATVSAKGDSAYNLALDAINSLSDVFSNGPVSVGISWTPKPTYANPQDKTIAFSKPSPAPKVSDYQLNIPEDPQNVMGGLADVGDLINDILTELQALIDTLPEFEGVSINDLYLTLIDTWYSKLTTQIDAIINACPATNTLDGEGIYPTAILREWMSADGSVGMPAAVEQALRDRAFVTEDRKATQEQSAALSDWLARGFSLPGGALEAKLLTIAQQTGDQKAELSRDIFIESAKWERETRQLAVTEAIRYEGMRREFFLKVYEIARTIAGEWQANHIKVQLAKLEVYKIRLESFDIAAKALQSMGATAAELIRAKIAEQSGYIEVYKAKLQAALARIDADVKTFDSKLGLYKVNGDMESSRVGVQLRLEELDVQRERLDAETDIKSQELQMQKLLEVGKITTQAYSNIAQTAGTLAAGWTSALSMQASIRTDLSYNNNSSCNTSYSYQL